MGVSRPSLATLKSLMYDFRDYIGADTQVYTILPETIDSWIDEGGVRGGNWATITKSASLKRIRGFFTWCIKKDYLSTNPAAKLEGFILGESEPCYLKLDQVVEFLEITEKHDPRVANAGGVESVLRHPSIRGRTYDSSKHLLRRSRD